MTELFNVEDDTLKIDENKNYFEELVGEGKKFKDEQALARAKAESDAYIRTLIASQDEMRNEMKKLRDEVTAKAKLEDLIDRMQNNQNNSSNDDTDVKEENKPLFDPKAVENRMYEIIAEGKRKELEQQNYDTVVGKLQEKYGENFQPYLKQKVKELGLTDESVINMAKTMPQVLIRSLDLDKPVQQSNGFSSPRSSVRTDNFSYSDGPKRDWAYYQKVRKENPELYHSPKFTVQRHKDVQEMGERAFYGSAYDDE